MREEALEGSEIGVVLERHGDPLAECVRGARRGSEVEPAEAVEVGFEDRVRNHVDAAEVHADDRPDLARKAARRPVRRVVAELEVDAVEEPALVSVRADEERPELHAVEQQPAVAGERVDREIGPRLEPFGHAVGEFGHSVQRVLRHDASRDNRPGAARRGEVVVPGQVEAAGGGDLGVVDLNLVSLCMRHGRPREQADEHSCARWHSAVPGRLRPTQRRDPCLKWLEA